MESRVVGLDSAGEIWQSLHCGRHQNGRFDGSPHAAACQKRCWDIWRRCAEDWSGADDIVALCVCREISSRGTVSGRERRDGMQKSRIADRNVAVHKAKDWMHEHGVV